MHLSGKMLKYLMSKKKQSYSERLAGPVPKRPSYRDQLLAGFVKGDGTFCGSSAPYGLPERHLMPAHKKLRQEGLIVLSMNLGEIGKIFRLREGEKAASAALEAKRVMEQYRADLSAWHATFLKAHKALQNDAGNPESGSTPADKPDDRDQSDDPDEDCSPGDMS